MTEEDRKGEACGWMFDQGLSLAGWSLLPLELQCYSAAGLLLSWNNRVCCFLQEHWSVTMPYLLCLCIIITSLSSINCILFEVNSILNSIDSSQMNHVCSYSSDLKFPLSEYYFNRSNEKIYTYMHKCLYLYLSI